MWKQSAIAHKTEHEKLIAHFAHLVVRSVKGWICELSLFACSFLHLSLQRAHAQGTIPTFEHSTSQGLLHARGPRPNTGREHHHLHCARSHRVLLRREKTAGKPFIMDAAADVLPVLRSLSITHISMG